MLLIGGCHKDMKIVDVIQEYGKEYKKFKDIFPDGILKLTYHFDDLRRPERQIEIDRILDILQRASIQWPEKIKDLSNEEFVVYDWDGFGIALVKRESTSGGHEYMVKTARQDLRHSRDQQTIQVR
jgi:hypothetical protein